MAEEGLTEPLIITEERDEPEDSIVTASNLVVIAKSCSEELDQKKELTIEDKNEDSIEIKMHLEDQSHEKQQSNTEVNQTGLSKDEDKQEDDKPEEIKKNDGSNNQKEGQKQVAGRIYQKSEEPSEREMEKVPQSDPEVDVKRLKSPEQQPEGTESQEEDPKKAHRLTPDFPEALYELLFTVQEGRRLNDQRCSFRLENGVRRRRCHSEPNTNKPANRVIFSSMTSLQREEFFELVATAQARRLDDQRAQLERSPTAKPKSKSFRGSLKQLSFVKRPAPLPAPVPVPKEELYNMILTTQAQGRLEDQRSRAPGPMDDEDFFSLLLRVQGGRMDEQRTELPCLLQT
ncbi:G-protein-signaling modulator 1 [Antennarius striatus]|uniref:G-protein-signaling modulator 1 n=1 Tax=Antennarius striatus TaxID=241820 RepID=UPI0035B19508